MTVPYRKVGIKGSGGNQVAVELGADGNYHLATAIIQDVFPDENNSSVVNLDAANSYTFTGVATSTLGVTGLQWSLKTDQNATIFIDESPDGINWDLVHKFDYIESHGGAGATIQATQTYWRIRVVLTVAIDTTFFRLSAVLAPIAVPLPSALTRDSRLKVEAHISGAEDRHAAISPTNTLNVNTMVMLAGSGFDGTNKDPNFWTEAVAGSGAVAQDGEIELTTGETLNSAASYKTVENARAVESVASLFFGAYRFVTEATSDNVRRCGAYDVNNGYFFQLDGSTFSVGSRKSTVDTLIESGSFNGDYGSTFIIDPAIYYKLTIEWTSLGAFYYVDDVLLHKSVGGHLTDNKHLPITFENVNYNDNTTPVAFDCLGTVICRMGEFETRHTSKRQSGVTSGVVCKYGPGTLKGIVVSAVVNGADINIYDGLSNAGTLIWPSGNQGARTEPFNVDFYGLSFSTGLTLEIVNQSADVVIVYE